MAFQIAVSGIQAANSDLSVIGNNLANASTVGFKGSSAVFGDVYAASGLGGGSNTIGSGVLLTDVKQSFQQGNINFTKNSLDMAINGEGFFVLENQGSTEYSRAGLFSVNKDGFIEATGGAKLQGFAANDLGEISGTLSDLQIDTGSLEPVQTVRVDAAMNLDASEVQPAERGSTTTSLGAAVGVVQAGGFNAYQAETFDVTYGDGSTRSVTSTENDSAAVTASQINGLPGVAASASNSSTLSNITDNGTLQITLNGVIVANSTGAGSVTPQSIAIAINDLSSTTLRNISALHDDATGTVNIVSSAGDDLQFSLRNTADALDTITVSGSSVDTVQLNGDASNDGLSATTGGIITIALEEDVVIDTDGDGTNLFDQDISLAPFINGSFDEKDQGTYNHATSVNIFDSLGSSHIMTTYFVKESELNSWTAYVKIDGEDVGDPNLSLDPPFNTNATLAAFNLKFNNDGTFDEGASDPIRISYWNPVDENGNVNGSLSGLPLAQGAVFPQEEPYTSSNFEMDISDITQYGTPFSVEDLSQNGYTTGRISGIDISSDGLLFARYTNGESKSLAQIGLANFRNTQGLQPNGNTAWVETSESGNPVVGSPNTSSLGVIQAGALEDANVDLSSELVKLIIAQRNFQANAKTIQTADAAMQAVINIR